MGIKGIFKFFLQRIVEFTFIILLVLLIPNLPPYTSFSDSFSIPPSKPLEGKLALNEKLNGAEIWHKGELHGPEAFAHYNGELYTSLSSGDIVKVTGDHISPIVKFGKPCKGAYEERICGRPLGIEFDKSGTLYAADAYYGIFRVNIKTGEKERLISPNIEINGKKPKIFNSIALASNGDIYWSDSSSEFTLEDGVFEFLSDPSGRLIHYDARTKQNKVLIDKIAFANGVILSDDEEFVLVAESLRSRIYRYYLKGDKQGTHDIFIDRLPGNPDNLNSDGLGGFLIPLVAAVDKDHPSLPQIVSPFPYIKKFLARMMGLSQLLFETVNRVYPNEVSQQATHFIGHFTSVTAVLGSKRVTIIHLSKKGEILDSVHNVNQKLSSIAEAHIFRDTLYLGSPFNDYFATIPLSTIGWGHLSHERTKRDVPPKVDSTINVPTTPPPKQTAPPQRQENQPPQQQPPKQQTPPAPPKQQTTQAPTKQPSPPAPQHSPPIQQTSPPKQEAPPKQQTAPKQQTPPTQQTPPPRQQTPPPEQKTVPQKKQETLPLKQQTPPQQETLPPKQQTPPTHQETPPQRQQTPPPEKRTPPPPKKETPPPPKKETPPPSERETQPPKQQTRSTNQQNPSTNKIPPPVEDK